MDETALGALREGLLAEATGLADGLDADFWLVAWVSSACHGRPTAGTACRSWRDVPCARPATRWWPTATIYDVEDGVGRDWVPGVA